MKSRYSSLVVLKKKEMQKSEQELQRANQNFYKAKDALQKATEELREIVPLQNGTVSDFLANRTLFEFQRDIVKHNREWLQYTQKELLRAKEALKEKMIEYEKFEYLQLQEIEKILQKQKIKEQKDMDEIAIMTYRTKSPYREVL